MDAIKLAEEIIGGRRITRGDDLSFFLNCDLDELCKGADMIREKFVGDKWAKRKMPGGLQILCTVGSSSHEL